MELHAAKLQSVTAYIRRRKADTQQPVFQRAIRAVGEDSRSYVSDSSIGGVLKLQNIFKGIVVTKAGIAASVFKCSVENAKAHTGNQLRRHLVRHANSWA